MIVFTYIDINNINDNGGNNAPNDINTANDDNILTTNCCLLLPRCINT